MKKTLLIIIIILVAGTSYAQTRLFIDPEFHKIGYEHKTIAVVPFITSISLRPKQMKELKDGELKKMEMNESDDIQRAMYSWFLKRRQQGKLWVDIQDVITTNSILKKNGVNYDNIQEKTHKEIANLLGVDAIIRGTFETNKPMSDGASIALGILFGAFGSTNKATVNMFIHNGNDGKVLVNYNKGVVGSIGSTSDQLINVIMRKASRRIPYTKPKEY